MDAGGRARSALASCVALPPASMQSSCGRFVGVILDLSSPRGLGSYMVLKFDMFIQMRLNQLQHRCMGFKSAGNYIARF